MIKMSVFIFCLVFLLPFVGAAQQPTPQVSHEILLERVKKQDSEVDFKELRFAYTETKRYSTYFFNIDKPFNWLRNSLKD